MKQPGGGGSDRPSNMRTPDPFPIPASGVCACALAIHGRRTPTLLALLSEPERQRSAAYRREEDRERFVLGRAMTRLLCARVANRPPADVAISLGPQGKPCFEGSARLHFNVAHSGDWVVLAWSESGPVGVDVERVRQNPAMPSTGLAERVLAPEELAALESVPREKRPWTFARIWVRKEAVVKAEGSGIALGLNRFCVARPAINGIEWATQIELGPRGHVWSVTGFDLDEDHPAALAAAGESGIELRTPVALGFW